MVSAKSLDNLKPFQKGQSGYRGGKNPAEINELKGQAKLEVVEAINRSMLMTMEELTSSLQDPKATIAQQLVGRILVKAMKEGCHQKAQFVMNYVLGRPKTFENDDNSGPDNPTPQGVLGGVPSSILLELMQRQQNGGKSGE